jgi:hypothetical protein
MEHKIESLPRWAQAEILELRREVQRLAFALQCRSDELREARVRLDEAQDARAQSAVDREAQAWRLLRHSVLRDGTLEQQVAALLFALEALQSAKDMKEKAKT